MKLIRSFNHNRCQLPSIQNCFVHFFKALHSYQVSDMSLLIRNHSGIAFSNSKISRTLVPGRTYPVAEYYLEDLLDGTDHFIEHDSKYAFREDNNESTASLHITGRGGEKRKEIVTYEDYNNDLNDISDAYEGYKLSTRRYVLLNKLHILIALLKRVSLTFIPIDVSIDQWKGSMKRLSIMT